MLSLHALHPPDIGGEAGGMSNGNRYIKEDADFSMFFQCFIIGGEAGRMSNGNRYIKEGDAAWVSLYTPPA